MRKAKIGRRRLLQALGASALGLPFLRSTPSAAAGEFPKRVLFYFVPNEPVEMPLWRPIGQGNDFALPATLPEIFEPFTHHKAKTLWLGNLEMRTAQDDWPAGHVGAGHILTGRTNDPTSYQAESIIYTATGESVDQYIANEIGSRPLNLAVTPGPGSNGNARTTYSGPGQVVDPFVDPLQAWRDVFSGFTGPAEVQDELRAQRTSVLDAVAGNLGRVRATLPAEDRTKLDGHLAGIEALEEKINQPVTLTCEDEPVEPSTPAGYDFASNDSVPDTHRLQMDIMAQALACGVTDVGTIQLGGAGGAGIHPAWANDPLNPLSLPENIHNTCHTYSQDQTGNAAILDRRVRLEQWLSGQFAYMLDALDAIPEGEGTLLDNTMVVWCRELGFAHVPEQMLFILAGGANMGIPQDRYIEYPGGSGTSVPHNNVLVSCCQAMGIDTDVFGDPKYCTGPMAW